MEFLQNMLENGHSNLQTKFGVHITSNIFKIIQFKNHHPPPTSQLWKCNFEHQGEICWGLLQPPLGELGLNSQKT